MTTSARPRTQGRLHTLKALKSWKRPGHPLGLIQHCLWPGIAFALCTIPITLVSAFSAFCHCFSSLKERRILRDLPWALRLLFIHLKPALESAPPLNHCIAKYSQFTFECDVSLLCTTVFALRSTEGSGLCYLVLFAATTLVHLLL